MRSGTRIVLVVTHLFLLALTTHFMKNEPTNQNDKMNDSAAEEASRNASVSGQYGDPQAAASSESLVDSEMSVGQGAVTGEKGTQENKEAKPSIMGENPDRNRLSGNRSN